MVAKVMGFDWRSPLLYFIVALYCSMIVFPQGPMHQLVDMFAIPELNLISHITDVSTYTGISLYHVFHFTMYFTW